MVSFTKLCEELDEEDNVVNTSNYIDRIIRWENGMMQELDDVAELFQFLLDRGIIWQLQGAYQRQLEVLVGMGVVHIPKRSFN